MTNWFERVIHDAVAWWRGDLSHRWLRTQHHQEQRIEFHGVAWAWPANRSDSHDRKAA